MFVNILVSKKLRKICHYYRKVSKFLLSSWFQEINITVPEFQFLLTEGDITGPGDGIPPEDIPGDMGFPGMPAPTWLIGGALNPFWL